MNTLFVPWILLVLVIILVITISKKWYKTSVLLFMCLIAANWHWQVFSFGLKGFEEAKGDEYLRVLTWNTDMTIAESTEKSEGIADVILSQGADLVFLTEYGEDGGLLDSLINSRYPYSRNFEPSKSRFYSTIPADSIYHIDVLKGKTALTFCYSLSFVGKPIRIYTCHLASNNHAIQAEDVQTKEGLILYLRNYESQSRFHWVELSDTEKDMNGDRCVVMGDFNDVIGSPVLSSLDSLNLQNSWWEGGFGYGATIYKPLPYRIDHIYHSEGLMLKGIKKVSSNRLSDHDALVADFEIE